MGEVTTTEPIAVPSETTTSVTTTTTTTTTTAPTTSLMPSLTTTQKAPEAPKTGDELAVLPFLLMAAAAAVSTMALKLKKREN